MTSIVVPSQRFVAFTPDGRLTLTTSVPITPDDVLAATIIYYTPHISDTVPIYNGTKWEPHIFTELLLNLVASGTGFQSADFNYDLFVFNDAGTLRLGTGPAWTRAATVTMTIATPCIVTWTANGLSETSSLVFTTTGALPTGVTAGTTYYKKTTPDSSTFQIAATAGGAAINTSGTQSGVHTGTESNTVRGTGAGTTELTRLNGLLVNANSMTVRWGSGASDTSTVAANQGTYVGTMRASASGQAEDSLKKRFLWNMFNRVSRPMKVTETADSWTYSTFAWRQMNNSVLNQLSVVRGLNEDAMTAAVAALGSNTAATGLATYCGVGLNVTSGYSGLTGYNLVGSSNLGLAGMHARFSGLVGIGYNWLAALEEPSGATTTWYGDTGVPLDYAFGIIGHTYA